MPHILEKIVEKIVVMPQVVEVLKYVHEIAESDTLIGVGVDISVQEARYRDLYGKLKIQFDVLLVELRKLKAANPGMRVVIEVIEAYLVEFDKIAAFQRIIKVPTQVEVEHEVLKPILVPTKDSAFVKSELALSLLVEKLVLELKRLKKENPSLRLNLEDDVQLVFLTELGGSGNLSGDFAAGLRAYTDGAMKKFSALGGNWARDHELMLYTILQERFTMANLIKNANLEIEKAKAISDKRLEGLRRYKQANSAFIEKYKKLESALAPQMAHLGGAGSFFSEIRTYIDGDFSTIVIEEEPMRIFGDLHGTGEDFARLQGMYREAMYNVDLLREKLIASEKARVSTGTTGIDQSRTLDALRKELHDTHEEIKRLRTQHGVDRSSVPSGASEAELRNLRSRNQDLEAQLRTAKNEYDNQIRALESKLREANGKIETYERQLRSAKVEDSRATGYTPVTPSSQTSFGTTSTPKPNTGSAAYGSGNTPSSSSSSSYTPVNLGTTNLSNSGVKQATSNYGYTANYTTGASNLSGSGSLTSSIGAGLTSSGVRAVGTTATSYTPSSSSGSYTGYTGATTGTTGSTSYGTYGTTGNTGTTGATGTTYGAGTTFGTVGGSGSGYSASFSSSTAGQGRSSGTGTSGTSYTSGYNYTK